jgi:hypothetical protein
LKELLPYVGLIALVLSLVNAAYQRRKDQQGDWSKRIDEAVKPYLGLPDSVFALGAELKVLQKQMEVFWRGVSFSSAAALHSPHTPELDALLEAFQRDELKDEQDLKRLKAILIHICKTDDDPFRRKLATDILTLIRVRFEIGGNLLASLQERDRGLHNSMDRFSRRLK